MANEWTNWKEHGITKDTPDSILFGAGTIHQGLTLSGDKWNFAESIIGATNGGSKVSMKPEVQDIEVDGKLIKAKGLMMKVGETATMEINFAEISPEIIKKGLIAQEGNSTATGYKVIESKPDIEAGDYFENFAFVGRTVSKKPIIVIFDDALCTSGFELDAKNKSQSSPTVTVECVGDVNKDEALKVLPYHIYYPDPAASQSEDVSGKAVVDGPEENEE